MTMNNDNKYNKYNKIILDKIKEDEKLNSFIKELNDEQIEQYLSLLYSQALDNEKCKNCKGKKPCVKDEENYQSYLMLIDGKVIQKVEPCEYVNAINYDLVDVLYYPLAAFEGSVDTKNLVARGPFFLEQKKIVNGETKIGTYLYGTYGTGKSFLTFHLVNSLTNQGKKAIFCLVPELVRVIKSNLDKPNFMDELIVRMKNIDVLVLDDIGGEINSPFARDEILFPILDSRMNECKLTFFTSNLSMEELENHFSEENKKSGNNLIAAGRIMQRIRVLAKEIQLVDKNYRELNK